MASHTDLPDISSPSLTLVHPTEAERLRIWSATHPQWGTALSLQSYLDREFHLLEGPLSNDGGQTQWMLTDGNLPPNERPILASCDTLKKASLVSKDGALKEGISHGVASVFTFPECRGRGYAGKLMTLLGKELERQQKEKDGNALFSVLYSDIGKNFYNKVGWNPFESSHLEFPTTNPENSLDEALKPITYADLPALAARDEQLIRKQLSTPSLKTRLVILPNSDSLNWHLYREDFMCNHIFSRLPTVRGAVYTPLNSPNSRIWAVWERCFYGGRENPAKNTLHFLRFVVEDEGLADEDLVRGIKAIVGLAQKDGKEWLCAKVEWWNPDERIKRLAGGIEGAKYIVRESDSIASLQWFGDGSVDEVEWIANEKVGWC
ncbi:Fc.00g091910.m01.CDS01 [Cosmosporella sp. VM-42]